MRVSLNRRISPADAWIFVFDSEVQASVLDNCEYIERQLSVFEQVEETLHVSNPCSLQPFAFDGFFAFGSLFVNLVFFNFSATILEDA